MVKTDETGLHAEDCACEMCELGYRPSERARAAARRAALAAKLAAARRAAAMAQTPPPVVRPRLDFVAPPPMTAAELEAMRADCERFRKSLPADQRRNGR